MQSTGINNIIEYIKFQKELGFEYMNIPLNDKKEIVKAMKKINSDEKQTVVNKKTTTTTNTATVSPNWKNSNNLTELKDAIQNCKQCALGENRTNFVFGEGNPNADVLIIGEAPGKDEDLQGKPFVGRSGQLLTKILEAVGFKREDVFIANICKCRPPENRRPERKEVDTCEPYLAKQIELINPQFIISLGLTSIDTLMKTKHKMADIRGQFMDYHGRKLMVTYHPAALLRNPNWKRTVWEDMKTFKVEYDKYMTEKS